MSDYVFYNEDNKINYSALSVSAKPVLDLCVCIYVCVSRSLLLMFCDTLIVF